MADASALYAVGTCLSKLDGDGKLEWSKGFGATHDVAYALSDQGAARKFGMVVSKEGDAVYAVVPQELSVLQHSTFTRYDADGEVVWQEPKVEGTVASLNLEPTAQQLVYTLFGRQANARTSFARMPRTARCRACSSSEERGARDPSVINKKRRVSWTRRLYTN